MCRQSEFQKGRNHKLQHAALQLVTDHKRRTSNINQIPPFSENEGGGGGKKKCTYTSHVISWYHFTPDSLLDSLRPTRTTVSTVSRQQGSDQGRHRTEGRVRFECEDWPPGSGLDVSPPCLGLVDASRLTWTSLSLEPGPETGSHHCFQSPAAGGGRRRTESFTPLLVVPACPPDSRGNVQQFCPETHSLWIGFFFSCGGG